MATKKITFDPDAEVAYPVNLTINTGANFKANFEIVSVANTAFDFTGYTGSGAMAKSVAIGASYTTPAATFTVGFTSAADGKFYSSLTSTQTRTLNEGRYVYDVNIKSGVGTVYRIIDGMILVRSGVATVPS